MSIKIPESQRALIFQGGGALGAYEVGFYQAVYEKFIQEKKHKHPFDIIVGTSIGAINGAILVSYYKKHYSWDGSSEHLKEFWKYLSSKAIFSDAFTEMWHYWRQFFPNAPSKEEARRTFAVKEFLHGGVPNVFSTPKLRYDIPFLGLGELWFQSSNEGLKQSLEKFIDFPITTEYEKDEPRLLLVAVDVQESLPVVFDSYKQADGKRKTVYGQTKLKDGRAEGGFLIEYDGIEVEHILASANVPINYDYTKITANQINGVDSKGKQVTRYLWDGGVLHNTPMVPLIYHHKKFWDNYIGIEKQRNAIFDGGPKNETQIPELRTFVVDMWAKKSKKVPETYNETKSRYYEIMFSDKTEYEERIMSILDDFVMLSKNLIGLAKQKGATKSDLEKILMPEIDTQFYAGVKRSYIDHIRGKFPMKIIRIQRSEDPDDIADQAFDFSLKTIKTLFHEGYEDTKKEIEKF
jgi:predicted acylesterase/phospholipase RssA